MLWLKAFHLIVADRVDGGDALSAAAFRLSRRRRSGSEQSETFKVMERRLLRAIMTPAMIATWVFGLWLAIAGGCLSSGGWLHAKLALVLVLSAFHGFCARWTKDFAADRNRRPARFYRLVNELPAVLMVAIVLLVVVKPF